MSPINLKPGLERRWGRTSYGLVGNQYTVGFEERADLFHRTVDGHGSGVEQLAEKLLKRVFPQVEDLPGRAEKAIPYGIYDMAADTSWVPIGTGHDTAAFAVASIHRWWQAVGTPASC